jgi:hypothetical protein
VCGSPAIVDKAPQGPQRDQYSHSAYLDGEAHQIEAGPDVQIQAPNKETEQGNQLLGSGFRRYLELLTGPATYCAGSGVRAVDRPKQMLAPPGAAHA